MLSPSTRFTGIFIPAEILELEELSLFETILLSWIDALYCPEHGGCFASNDYLGKKIKGAQENTVAKAISKLRKLELIEDVSFDGRTRVVRSTVNRYVDKAQSKSALDKNPIGVGRKSNPGLDENPITTTPSPYISYSKEERKEDTHRARKRAPPPPPSAESVVLCDFFQKKKEEYLPGCKPLEKKATQEMDKLLTKDKRDPKEISLIIEWVFDSENPNGFYRKTIESPRHLGRWFDKARAEMKENKISETKQEKVSLKEAVIKKNKEWAKRQKDLNPVHLKNLNIYRDFVSIPKVGDIPYFLPEEDFIRQFKKLTFAD